MKEIVQETAGIKTLKEFQALRTLMTVKDFEEEYGIPMLEDDIRNPYDMVISYGGMYIEISPSDKGSYYLLIDRSEYEGDNLSHLEQLLWDDFAKDEFGLTDQEILDDLHERARQFMTENGFAQMSLDELFAQFSKNWTPTQVLDATYLMRQFDEAN